MIRLLVLQTLPRPDIFSPRNALLTLARHLDRSRYAMTVAVPQRGLLTRALEAEGIQVVTVAGLKTYRRHDAFWRYPMVAIRIARLASQLQADLLMSNHAELGPFADAAARWRHVPWICFLRQAGRPASYYRKYRVARADAVVAVSEAALSSYCEFLHRTRRKAGILAVVHTGIDIPPEAGEENPSTRFVGEDLRPVLGSVGLRRVKRPDLLLEIFARIRPRVPEALCILIGSDNEGAIERLEKLSSSLGIAGDVELPGQQQDMNSWYRRMHVYAHASRSEALPKAALEAMSHGLPVVAFDVGGNREVVKNGETGLLCPEGDHEAFGRNLERLLRDRELARRMGLAGRARVQRDFSPSAMVHRMTLLFDRVAALRVGEPESISPRTA